MRSNFLKPAAQEKSTPRKRPCITSPQRAPIGRNPAKKLKGLTEEEWSAYFRGLSVVKLGLKGGKIDPHVRQSINGKPLVAIPIIFRASLLSRHYTQLFTLIDYVSVPICAEVVKAMSCCKKMHIPQAVEAKIRQTVNASAESQLEAIQYPLLEEFFGDLQSLECIYEWVKQGKYMDSLPKRFATPEVVVELVRLGNAKVFRWFRNKTLELCMAVLKIDHTCIKWIGGDLQTKEMSDYVLSRSVDNYAYLANHLKTIDNSWKALNHNLEMFSLIPDNSTSRGMVKYVIQNFNSSINKYLEKKLIHEGNYVGDLSLSRKLGRCLVANADLAWYVIEKNPELIAELSLHLWMPFDALMLEHICKHCSQRVIQACYPNMLDSPTFRENIPTLIMRDPHSISFFAGEIKITEEMSVCAMEAAPKQLFRHCTLTPKVLKMACEADMDLFDSIKVSFSTPLNFILTTSK